MFCVACGVIREPASLIAFWPVGRPDLVRFVCRATEPSPVTTESCFRAMVGPADVHAIAAADLFAEAPPPGHPVLAPAQP